MKPIGYDAPWLAIESDRPFEQWIVETWVEEMCACTAMLAVADLESLYALVFHPDGLPEYQLRAVATDLIVAGATLGDPDPDAAGRLASAIIASAGKNGSGQQFDPPAEWDGEARVLLIALLWIAAGKGPA